MGDVLQDCGQIIEANIIDSNEKSYFAQNQGITYKVDKAEFDRELFPNERVEGFIFENINQEKCLTTIIPDVRLDSFGWSEVVSVRRDLGVFVDIGLPDKDVVISSDDLPEDKQAWPKKGDKLFITLSVDAKNRLWGVLASQENFQPFFKHGSPEMMNINIIATVYRVLNVGVQAISDANIPIFVHESEMVNLLRLGEVFEARVIDYHKNGGTLNASTKPRAYQAIDEDAAMIQAVLEKSPGNFIPLHDKSHPLEIRNYLGISKGQFKRALGSLLKKQRVRQEKGEGIYLVSEGSEHG